ncbi:tRNA (adenosine(37)-N6)-dimethylallyltransferase MiaA [Lentibacillus sp. CBA3610]|uniref:tRNA (adenosine(37)-N6)-dimethylallyltransferase MiaA n=1 Tax=Lentibacillus sp. CBA3610 TaxID=2518176 RepID=UPI00159A2CA6|nr:tRNA (adenosine(37)-N6)-dimethylallyltransferase MiaA [Lentibacillus sp. CBA3610]QKY69101.1 tRNA (adenosine(37)-N6)-dimethylallyltransferase MiaA [Lentibacillus sp. CBA3610]
MKKTVIAIVGPTAVGKTGLSVEIAGRFNGEVISGDSMQVYKGLDIGTAKITDEEKQGVPHYMLDIKHPEESFSVADYQRLVQHYIEEIDSHGKVPIIAGGSGLYIQAALFDYHFSRQRRDEKVTQQLERRLNDQGADVLYNYLQRVDPDQAAKIHPNNHRRLIRALEVYETTGITMSEYQKNQTDQSPYNPIFIGLEMDRDLLYKRINNRVDQMLDQGLLEEAKSLYNHGYENHQAMRGIGYKEFVPYLKGEQPFDETVRLLKRNSRRYAKRQYTWFKNKMNVNWYTITPEKSKETFRNILTDLAGMLQNI